MPHYTDLASLAYHGFSTARNSKESSLLRLPGELRNKIYKYATSGQIISLRRTFLVKDRSLCPVKSCLRSPAAPFESLRRDHESNGFWPANLVNLEAVCKQACAETGVIDIWANNTFIFESPIAYRLTMEQLPMDQREKFRVIVLYQPVDTDTLTGSTIGPSSLWACGLDPFRTFLPKLEKIILHRPTRRSLKTSRDEADWLLASVLHFERLGLFNTRSHVRGRDTGHEFLSASAYDFLQDRIIPGTSENLCFVVGSD